MTRRLIALAALVLISSCGIKGDLDPAPPMWGSARQDYDRKQAEEAAAEAAKQEADRAARAESGVDVPDAPPAPGEATPGEAAPAPQ
jgi:Prokaryotic lipoprotein-attachment site